MRLHSIPPRTMGTLMREVAGPPASGRIVQVRQNVPALLERLQPRRPANRPKGIPDAPPSELRLDRVTREPGGAPAGLNGKHGRVYRRANPGRPTDLVIPPRNGPSSKPTTHRIRETAQAYVVSIAFPVPVRRDEVRWELHRDVLEVEHLGPAFPYYHAFLVPANTEPAVEHGDRTVSFSFPKRPSQPL